MFGLAVGRKPHLQRHRLKKNAMDARVVFTDRQMVLTSCGHWSADSVRENNTGENIKRIFKAAKQNTRERDGGTSPCHHSA